MRAPPTGARGAKWPFVLCVAAGLIVMLTPGPVRAEPSGEVQLEASTRRAPLSGALARGEVSTRTFLLAGVPVRGAFETVYLDPRGRQRITSSRRPVGGPQFLPGDARIAAAELPTRVAAALGLPAEPEFEEPPRLVYLLVLGEPILCWETQLPLVLGPEPSRKTLWVSAMTGRVLREQEQVLSARARVFPENPSKTPEPIEVELGGIEASGPGAVLEGLRVTSFNCSAEEPDEIVPWWDEGDCYPVHSAVSDENGDFFVPLPSVIVEADNRDAEDAYAELSMYYHAERFLDVMASRGVEEFKCERATMLANLRGLEPSSSSDYSPLNNAFFTGQCDPEKGATMLFGQGSDVDFAYDGDVVYHELGHGMVSLLTPEGLGERMLREDGSSSDAGAINEGIADYFAFTMTDDGRLAEYVGRFWSGTSGAEIRSADNQNRCPEDITSQVHNDGEPLMAALWAARSRLGLVVDDLVLTGLTRLPPDASLEEAARTFLDVAKELEQSGDLDHHGVELVERSFAARGLLLCPRVITDVEEAAGGRSMYLRRVTPAVKPFYPGPMQLRGMVAQGETSVEVRMSLRSQTESVEPTALVLVKHGDEPISFTYDLVAVDDPGDSTGGTGMVREVVLVGGDWDLEVESELRADGEYVARIDGLRAGDVVHVSVAATSTADVVASGVAIVSPGVASETDETGGDTEEEGGQATRDEVEAGNAVASGCGCGLPAGPARDRLVGLGIVLTLTRRRRWHR